MNSSSKVEPFILKSIEEIEETESNLESAFISFFNKTEQEKQVQESELKDKKDAESVITEDERLKSSDVEAEVRKIFEEAYREGEKAGYEMGMKKVEPLIKRLNKDLADIASFKKDILKKVEKTSIELALYFTEILVLKECIEHREILMDMIKKAIEICEDRTYIKVRMRRDDIKYLTDENIKTFNIIPDDTLDEPGFIIETNFGEIDGRISTQINELKRQLLLQDKDE